MKILLPLIFLTSLSYSQICDSTKFSEQDPNYPDSTEWYEFNSIVNDSANALSIYEANDSINFDGKLDDSDWKYAKSYDLSNCEHAFILNKPDYYNFGYLGQDDLKFNLRFTYDNIGLYLGIELIDDQINTESFDSNYLNLEGYDGFSFILDMVGEFKCTTIDCFPPTGPYVKYKFKINGTLNNDSKIAIFKEGNAFQPDSLENSGSDEVEKIMVRSADNGNNYITAEILIPWEGTLLREAFFYGRGGSFYGWPRDQGEKPNAPAIGKVFKMNFKFNDFDEDIDCNDSATFCKNSTFSNMRGKVWWDPLIMNPEYLQNTDFWPWFVFSGKPDSSASGKCAGFLNDTCSQVKIENNNRLNSEDVFISPNPFNPSTTISFPNLTHNANIFIYDIRGKVIRKKVKVRSNKFRWNASGHANGIYLLKVISDNKVYQKKLVLHK